MIISHYQPPWYYILFMVVLSLIGYVYFIHPDVQVLIKLHQQKFTLQESIKSFSKQISTSLLSQYESPQLHAGPAYSATASLAILAQTYGLIIKKINSNSIPKLEVANDKIELQLIAEANYQQLEQFFSALALQKFIMDVTDFNFAVDKNDKIRIILHVVMDANQFFLIPMINPSVFSANIFCSAKTFTMSPINDYDELQAIPISSIKYTGYLKLGGHLSAMVLLPNQHVQLIELGSVIGKEHGKTLRINNQSLLIALPNGKTFTLQID